MPSCGERDRAHQVQEEGVLPPGDFDSRKLRVDMKEKKRQWEEGIIDGSEPQVPGPMKIYSFRKQRIKKLQEDYIEEEVRKAEFYLRRKHARIRDDRSVELAGDGVLQVMIDAFIYEIVRDTKVEGEDAKARAQEESGMVFNAPKGCGAKMQIWPYRLLVDMWIARKEELREVLNMVGAVSLSELRSKELDKLDEMTQRSATRTALRRSEEEGASAREGRMGGDEGGGQGDQGVRQGRGALHAEDAPRARLGGPAHQGADGG